ncbi:diketogulonate reductase-like aldo/keto reductase [Murinocardiopsis flavida]|uniref:Diketogulonate reductase-like aldo/keto reductase n=1 Tax=Murinocardiopsis flavida TaxID=645275 RepID=A0A2P8CZU2_9ACTN|nr:aldo/keto reductase [Murinocardiopsis flavida]PSK90467.1 diketogulonate reductase-like aldo/keto reductase [Murinocardiopsis flavida]
MDDSRTIGFGAGITVPVIGQGTWRMGEDPAGRDAEVRALRTGLDLGMTLIDTAEMYGEGGAERIVGAAIAGRRDDAVVVSKVYPHNAGARSAPAACERSLDRLGTDYIDLYLLHWRGSVPLAETVEAMRGLVAAGKIRAWGVSNFDAADMAELWRLPGGTECATDQVLYHAGSRGVDRGLLPWCRDHGVPAMAYCPLAQGGRLRRGLLGNPVLAGIAEQRGITPAQAALAWVIRDGDVLAIPKAVGAAHVRENADAAAIVLTPAELAAIDAEFPAPSHEEPLDIA